MKSLIHMDLTVTRKRIGNWIILSILMLFLAVGYVATYFSLEEFEFGAEILLPAYVFEYTLLNLSGNGVLIAVIMGGLYFGTPFSWGTYSTRLTRDGSRSRVFVSKMIVAVIVLFFWLVAGLIVGHVISYSFGLIEGNIAYGTPGLWPVLRGSLLTVLTWLVWFMFGGTISLWSRGTAMGIGGGLAYYFLENIFVFAIPGFSNLVEEFKYLFIGQSTSAVTSKLFTIDFFRGASTRGISLNTGIAVMIAYLLMLIVMSWWRFKTMELAE